MAVAVGEGVAVGLGVSVTVGGGTGVSVGIGVPVAVGALVGDGVGVGVAGAQATSDTAASISVVTIERRKNLWWENIGRHLSRPAGLGKTLRVCVIQL